MAFRPFSVVDYLALKFPHNDIIEKGILTTQSRMIIGGHPGIGKSILATQLGIEVSRGDLVTDKFKSVKKRVLYVQEEIGPRSYQQRLEQVSNYYKTIDSFFIVSSAGFSFDDPALVLQLKQYIQALKIEILILDPLYKIHGRRENDATELAQLAQLVDRLIVELDIAVILVHHLRKPFTTNKGETLAMSMMDFRGSTVIPAWADTMLMLEATDEEDKVRLDFVKTRNAPEYIQSIYLRLDRQNMRFALIRGDGSSLLSIDDDIIEMLKTGGSISEGHILSGIKNLHMNVKLNIAHIRDSLNNLVMSGKLERQQGMVWIKPDIVSSGSDWELDNSSED